MEDKNLKYLIDIIFKILGLYEKVIDENNNENFTKENYIMYIEKALIDLGGYINIYREDEKIYNVLKKCKLSMVGILEFVSEGKDNHKLIRSKVLDMTNNISRCIAEGDNNGNV